MKKEEALHLMSLLDYGFLIIIDASGYLDSPVHSIYPSEENDEIVYSSQVFDERPLSEISLIDVKVYAPALNLWKYNTESINSDELDKYESFIEDISDLNKENLLMTLTDMGLNSDSMNIINNLTLTEKKI